MPNDEEGIRMAEAIDTTDPKQSRFTPEAQQHSGLLLDSVPEYQPTEQNAFSDFKDAQLYQPNNLKGDRQ